MISIFTCPFTRFLNANFFFFFVMKKTGVLDYETFTKSLDALEAWIVEAEETLQVQDPSPSCDFSTIQERMEDLKVHVLES